MGLFLLSLAVLIAMGGGLTLAGRAIIAVCGANWLRRPSLENLGAAAFLGTAAWLLGFGLLSHLGLAAGPAAYLLVAGLAGSSAWLVWRRRSWLRPCLPHIATVLVGTATLGTIFLTLFPTLRGNCFPPFGDQYTYITISEWLQDNPFSKSCEGHPHHPGLKQVINYQVYGYRMGAIFLLASIQALAPAKHNALEILPAVIAWGSALNALGIYLLCRWCFRLPRLLAAIAPVLAAVTFNPLYFSTYSGLLPQMYGTAGLAFLIALLTRLGSRARWRLGSAVLVGLAAASLISAYNEFVPLVLALGLAFLFVHVRRVVRTDRSYLLLRFTALAVFATVLAGNVELYRAAFALPHQIGTVVGYHLPWSAAEFWGFAIGTKPYWVKLKTANLAACVVATLLLTIGLSAAWKTKRAFLVWTNLAVLGLLVVYFLAAHDPWTGERGHTWSLFKLCQWGFPFLVVIQAVGLRPVYRWRPAFCGVAALLCLGACALYLREHKAQSRNIASYLHYLTGTSKPFKAWRQMGQRLDELGAEQIYLVKEPDKNWYPKWFVTYIVSPRPILNGDEIGQPTCQAVHQSFPPGTICLAWGRPPFSESAQFLPGGLSVLPMDEPVIFNVDNPNGLDSLPDQRLMWIGDQPGRLLVWTANSGRASLSLHAARGPSEPESAECSLTMTFPDGSVRTHSFRDSANVAEIISLPPGVSTIELCCADKPSGRRLANGDKRTLLVAVTQARLAWAESVHADP